MAPPTMQDDPLLEKFEGWLATYQAARVELPDGGTPQLPHPGRADDEAFILSVSDMAARMACGAHNDTYDRLRPYYAALLRELSTRMLYAMPEGSLAAAFRSACALGPTERGTCADVYNYTVQLLTGLGPASASRLARDVAEVLAHTGDFAVGDAGTEYTDPTEDYEPITNDEVRAVLPRIFRNGARGIKGWMTNGTVTPTNTDVMGQLAHAVITSHYVTSHPGHQLLLDKWLLDVPSVSGASILSLLPQDMSPYLLRHASGAIADLLRQGLPGDSPGNFKQPDILDVTTREVYEIKPLRQVGIGLLQVFGYLLTLNTTVLGQRSAAESLLKGQTLGGGWNNSGSAEVFLPGYRWHPAPFYVIPATLAGIPSLLAAVRPVPGLILYTYFECSPQEQSTANSTTTIAIGLGVVAIIMVAVTVSVATGGVGAPVAGDLAAEAAAAAAESAASSGGATIIPFPTPVIRAVAKAAAVVAVARVTEQDP